jgi:hypothetical protein
MCKLDAEILRSARCVPAPTEMATELVAWSICLGSIDILCAAIVNIRLFTVHRRPLTVRTHSGLYSMGRTATAGIAGTGGECVKWCYLPKYTLQNSASRTHFRGTGVRGADVDWAWS